MPVDVKYQTVVSAIGGRDGRARSQDGRFKVQLSVPKELGGSGGDGTNPEQLFAAAYSACFLGALKVAALRRQLQIPLETIVTATVGIGMRSDGGFGITADLVIALPGFESAEARDLVNAAHQICPYSNAIQNNIDVNVSVV